MTTAANTIDLEALSDPERFRASLLIDTDQGPAFLGDVADDWQQRDFRALDPGWRAVCGQPVDSPCLRGLLERGRGHSKTSDVAVMVSYALAASRRPLAGVCAAGDRDQAALLRSRIKRYCDLNPWLGNLLRVDRYAVTNPHTGSTLSVIASDVETSFGHLSDFFVLDEWTTWKSRDLFDSLLSAAGKRRHCMLLCIGNSGFKEHWSWGVREAIRQDPDWYLSHLSGPVASWISERQLAEQRRLLPPRITLEEFERMLSKTADVVGESAAPSWKYLLRGLWESGLRIDEIMHLAWDVPGAITPRWQRGRLPVLEIPAAMQKNDTEEAIPLLPGFEAVLKETPEAERTGWVFNPASLQTKYKRPVRHGRPDAEWAGKVVARIGRKAGIIVLPGDKPKFASAHDLRRSLGERLQDAGVSERDVARVLRHQNVSTTRRHYAPGNVQQAAGAIRAAMKAFEAVQVG